MLVLSRKRSESIVIGNNIEVMIVEVRGQTVRLGIIAPKETPIFRRELLAEVLKEKEQAE